MHPELRQRKPIRKHQTSSKNGVPVSDEKVSSMKRIFGFEWADFKSWRSFVMMMSRPMDPASLGVTRFLFGLLMSIDIPQERGLGHADFSWGDESRCRFPLFDFLTVLPLNWMFMVYLTMLIGAVGIMLGLFHRLSCLLFLVPYWYVFLLDKTSWNNHSYLYGLLGLLLLLTDANRYWSLDGLIWPRLRNTHVPLWNYTLLRGQVFLVYFIAGLKKMDLDWMSGYSMQHLNTHWVFLPFRMIMTPEQVDLFIVHIGGLTLDSLLSFFLFFDKTRVIGMVFGGSFHLMNSQIFSIGMFPYMMLATLPLFCYVDWPKKLISSLFQNPSSILPLTSEPDVSQHCIYFEASPKKNKIGDDNEKTKSKVAKARNPSWYHSGATLLTVMYLIWQCFMPYSHGLTKGYNNWTNGLYGYSWDMMVHSWTTQHIKISYYNKDTGETGYLNPKAWLEGSSRWSAHADMVKQYATCIQHRLAAYNITNVQLRFDVWRSMNGRFQQRMFDPRVDILTADWHPFRKTEWHMPLLDGLSDWRSKLNQMENELLKSSNHSDIVFVADFPGLFLENYVHEDLGNTTIHVLSGEVLVELVDAKQNISLVKEKSLQLPAGQYHNVHTVTKEPSCYMYIFVNTTEANLIDNVTQYEQDISNNKYGDDNVNYPDQQARKRYQQLLEDRNLAMTQQNVTAWQRIEQFWAEKYFMFSRAAKMTGLAMMSIVTREEYKQVLQRWDVDYYTPDMKL